MKVCSFSNIILQLILLLQFMKYCTRCILISFNKTTVFRIVEKFRETESVCDRKHAMSVTFLTHDRVCIVEGTLSQLPHKSLRILFRETGLSMTCYHRGTK